MSSIKPHKNSNFVIFTRKFLSHFRSNKVVHRNDNKSVIMGKPTRSILKLHIYRNSSLNVAIHKHESAELLRN